MKKRLEKRLEKLKYIAAAVTTIGCCFKFLYYPGGDLLFLTGTCALTVYFAARYFTTK